MRKVIHFILKYSWVILEYKDKAGVRQHKFNLWNLPIAYIVLILVSLIVGVIEGARAAWRISYETLKDSINSRKDVAQKPRN